MIKVSIIIPVYNTSKYLPRCLDSVISQSLKDIEIICINDGSTDDSLNILKKYHDVDNRIIILNLQNGGVARARNAGIKKAIGEFIGFVDSDDYVDNNYFENLYNQANDYDMIRGIRVVNNKHAKNPYGCLVPSIIRRQFLLKNNLFFPNKKVGEDSTLKRWILNHTNKVLETKDVNVYYHYEKRAGSLSNYAIKEEKTND